MKNNETNKSTVARALNTMQLSLIILKRPNEFTMVYSESADSAQWTPCVCV